MLSLPLLSFFFLRFPEYIPVAPKQKMPFRLWRNSILSGGELGIRTPGTFNSSTVFKTAAIDHSASSPAQKYKTVLNLQTKISFFELIRITHSK